jgi:Ca2+/Na+ antiporter
MGLRISARGRHLLGAGVNVGLFATLVVLLLVQSGSVRGEAVAGDDEWKIESVLEREEEGSQPLRALRRFFGKWGIRGEKECEEKYGILPCSTTLGGNASLLVIYGFMLLKAAQLLSDGSELLLAVMSPGIIGGLVLPILGALPDAMLVIVSGLGASQAEAQHEVLVGMGLVAGSSIMVLTVLWGSCLILGRCDLVPHPTTGQLIAKDRTLTQGFNLTKTGVTNDRQTKWASWIMMSTLLSLFVAQFPRLFRLNTDGRMFVAAGAVVAVLGLCGYITYQIMVPWVQEKRIKRARHRYFKILTLNKAAEMTKSKQWGSLCNSNHEPNEEVMKKLFGHFDDGDGLLTRAELKSLMVGLGLNRHNGQVPDEEDLEHWMSEFDVDNDGKITEAEFLRAIRRWMKNSTSRKPKRRAVSSSDGSSPEPDNENWDFEAQNAKMHYTTLEDEANDDDDEDDEEGKEGAPSRKQIIIKAICFLIAGAALAAIFADPLVDAIGGFSRASGISPFFISFIATPLATNSSEAISSLIFAKKKRKKNISMTYSQIYGAVTMNNTMCLGIFLLIVYFRHLLWDFSAEVSVIFFATLIMGSVAAFRTTLPLWMAFIGLALYPLSIALVAFLDYVCGWH